MEILTIIVLIIVGIVLLAVEILLIPGLSIAGIGCILSFGASVYLAFKLFGTLVGFITLLVILILAPAFLYFLLKSKAVKPMMLESGIDAKVKTVDEKAIHPGDQGTTIGRLAPGGKAKINGQTVEVRSQGPYIDPKTPIEVVKIEGNIVIVKPFK